MDRAGLAFLTVFGLAWWLAGASALGGSLLPVAALACGAVAAGGWRTGCGLRRPCGGPLPDDVRRRFAGINVLQWIVISVMTAIAVMSSVPRLIPGLIALVVGLHFLPLAVLFRQPRFHLTGALMVAVGWQAAPSISPRDRPPPPGRSLVSVRLSSCGEPRAWSATGRAGRRTDRSRSDRPQRRGVCPRAATRAALVSASLATPSSQTLTPKSDAIPRRPEA